MLRWLWRSNEQPSWFTVPAGRWEKETAERGHAEGQKRWIEEMKKSRGKKTKKKQEQKAAKKHINKRNKRTEGIENNRESQRWYWLNYWWAVIHTAGGKKKARLNSSLQCTLSIKEKRTRVENIQRERKTDKERMRDCYWHQARLIDPGLGGRNALWVSGACGLGEDRERGCRLMNTLPGVIVSASECVCVACMWAERAHLLFPR